MSMTMRTEHGTVEVIGDRLVIRNMDFDGPIVEVASNQGITQDPERLGRLFRKCVDLGGTILLHGQSQATIEAAKAEIDRLLDSTKAATDRLPAALQAELNVQLSRLADTLSSHFDGERVTSVQRQIAELVKGATAAEAKGLMHELENDAGPLARWNKQVAKQLRDLSTSQQGMVGQVTALVEKVARRLDLEAKDEKSTHKGLLFEDTLQAELESIYHPLGDIVRNVSREYGSVANSMSGDFTVTVNPQETRGREIQIVVEAKTGRLSGPKARKALEESIKSRAAAACVLVFDDASDAPLNGRSYCPYPDGRFIVVFDRKEQDPLALEVACRQARAIAIASIESDEGIDVGWLDEQCGQLATIVDKAKVIKLGTNAAKRGLETVDKAYGDLRTQAMAVVESIKHRLAGSA